MLITRHFDVLFPSFCFLGAVFSTAHGASISGQGTWENTLQGRDLDGNAATYEAYYDTILDVTWLADANAAGTTMNWYDANTWAAGLNVYGITGWRLPTTAPIDGNNFNTSFSNNATTDYGFAPTTTDGTDGGWRNNEGIPISELGHLYYVTLGNLGNCIPSDSSPDTCVVQPGRGLSNTGPFENIQLSTYWTDTRSDFERWWMMSFVEGAPGLQFENSFPATNFIWAVHPGDINAVPLPAAIWLFGSGLLGLVGIARRNKVTQPLNKSY